MSGNNSDRQQEDEAQSSSSSIFASTAVQIGAAILLGGGFYYGIAKQKQTVQDEKLEPPKKTQPNAKTSEQKKLPVIRQTTFLERHLGLDRPLTPNAAAWKALVGGTIVSVSGCALLVCGLGALLGVHSLIEFRERMEDVFPRMRKSVTGALHIQSKEHPHDIQSEEDEMNELASIFSEEKISREVKTAEIDSLSQTHTGK